MKKKRIIISSILLVLGLMTGMGYFVCQWSREREKAAEEAILQIDYKQQNRALAVSGDKIYSGYQSYESVDEEELYVRLTVYNEWLGENQKGTPELTLTDVEEYLSSEYKEDGTLRVNDRPEKIQRYMDWYFGDGNVEVEEYWNALQSLALDYYCENPEIFKTTTGNMNTEQLQELINKYNDPTYEINSEIMGETK